MSTQPVRDRPRPIDVQYVRLSVVQAATLFSGLFGILGSVFVVWWSLQQEIMQVKQNQAAAPEKLSREMVERLIQFEDRWRDALDDVNKEWNERLLQVAASNHEVTDKLRQMSDKAADERKTLSTTLTDVSSRIQKIEKEVSSQ